MSQKYYDDAHKAYLAQLEYIETIPESDTVELEKAKERLSLLEQLKDSAREDVQKDKESSNLFWSAILVLLTSGLHIAGNLAKKAALPV